MVTSNNQIMDTITFLKKSTIENANVTAYS